MKPFSHFSDHEQIASSACDCRKLALRGVATQMMSPAVSGSICINEFCVGVIASAPKHTQFCLQISSTPFIAHAANGSLESTMTAGRGD